MIEIIVYTTQTKNMYINSKKKSRFSSQNIKNNYLKTRSVLLDWYKKSFWIIYLRNRRQTQYYDKRAEMYYCKNFSYHYQKTADDSALQVVFSYINALYKINKNFTPLQSSTKKIY